MLEREHGVSVDGDAALTVRGGTFMAKRGEGTVRLCLAQLFGTEYP